MANPEFKKPITIIKKPENESGKITRQFIIAGGGSIAVFEDTGNKERKKHSLKGGK